jgi:hypothetical protein
VNDYFDVVITGQRLPGDKKGTDVVGYAKGSQPRALTILVDADPSTATLVVAREIKVDELCTYINLPEKLEKREIIEPRRKVMVSEVIKG